MRYATPKFQPFLRFWLVWSNGLLVNRLTGVSTLLETLGFTGEVVRPLIEGWDIPIPDPAGAGFNPS